MASVEVNQMLAAAAAACEDKKAEDIRILALDPVESGLADYFLICTGTNDRQTVAITDEIEIRLKRDFSTYPNSVEGRRQGEWILMDYVDFIVHVFLPEKRAFYGLERLRKSATTLSTGDLNAEIKAAIKAKRSPKPAKAPATVDEAAIGKHPADASSTRKTAGSRAAGPEAVGLTNGVSARAAKKSATVRKAGATTSRSAPAKRAGISAKKTTAKKAPAKKTATKKAAAERTPAAKSSDRAARTRE